MAHPFIIGGVLVLSVAGSVALIDLATAPVCAASAASEYRDSGGMRSRRSYSRRGGMRRANHRRYADTRRLSILRPAQRIEDRPAPAVEHQAGGGGRGNYFDETFGAWFTPTIMLPASRVPPVRAGEADDAASPVSPASSVSLPCN